MKKKILSAALLLAVFSSVCGISAAAGEGYAYVRTEVPEIQESEQYISWRTAARFADDKTPIALSGWYDGALYALIPTRAAGRPIEGFIMEDKPFADDPGENSANHWDYHIMEEMAARGVIYGDDMGRALPYNSVTRAEATAMIMRFMGLDSVPEANELVHFSDVGKNDWFCPAVESAYKYGIVFGDTETEFSPYREISREELTVMAVRAAEYAGMVKIPENPEEYLKENFNTEDMSEISDWAIGAYGVLLNDAPFDYEITPNESDEWDGTEDGRFSFRPQQAATRLEAADVLMRLANYYTNYPSELAMQYGFDKGMPVIDGSTSTYPFTSAIYGKMFSSFRHPEKPQKHSKSHISYQRLIKGEVDAIIASVYPSEDIVQMAAESGVELEMTPIAYDAMVFFTNADNPAEGLTKEQISDIYVENKYKNWSELGGPDALFYPYCRNNDSGSHAQMQRNFLNGHEIHEDIRRESTSYAMQDVLTDVIGAKTDDPVGYGLGYSIYYYYHNMDMVMGTKQHLKLLKIDGVYPTDETIADKSYPLADTTYLVIRADEPEGSKARRLAEFMLTDAGQDCVRQAGFGALRQEE